MNAVLVSLHTMAELLHYIEPLGVYQPCRVIMMLECSIGVTCQGCIHASCQQKAYSSLMDHVTLKGLGLAQLDQHQGCSQCKQKLI